MEYQFACWRKLIWSAIEEPRLTERNLPRMTSFLRQVVLRPSRQASPTSIPWWVSVPSARMNPKVLSMASFAWHTTIRSLSQPSVSTPDSVMEPWPVTRGTFSSTFHGRFCQMWNRFTVWSRLKAHFRLRSSIHRFSSPLMAFVLTFWRMG